MELSEEFHFPTKVHFVARSKCNVGAVFADRLVRKETEVIFYLGKVRVAVLGEEYLVIGPRKIQRITLHPEKPFSYNHSRANG